MILIIGAKTSGKRTYAMSLGYTADQMADACIDGRPVVFNVQEMVRNHEDGFDGLLDSLSEKPVVITTEVGSGVIPATEEDTRFRESAGRLAVELSQRAERVVRMVCGIPLILKG